MKYLSVCSGIEAATVAWEPLGWKPLAFSEIEPFPSAVLAHHWPDVPNLGDFTTIQPSDLAAKPDLLIGGTPCQAFSVAGLRNSLEDDRGNLTLEFVRLADRLSPDYIVWENVPGVLNTKDNAFGCFLGGLVGAGEPLHPTGKRWTDAGVVSGPERRAAWRVLDAQYFGVAQRRRRVFVVACPTDGADPAAVLLECDSLRRDTPPSREPREGSASRAGSGAAIGGDIAGTLTKRYDSSEGGTGRGTPIVVWSAEVAATLRRENGSPGYANQDIFSQGGANLVPAVCMAHGQANAERYTGAEETVRTLCADTHPGAYSGQDAYTGRLIPDNAPIVMAPAFSKRPGQQIATRDDGMSFALTSGEPPRVLAVRTAQTSANGHGVADDVAHTLDGANGQAIAFGWQDRMQKVSDEHTHALTCEQVPAGQQAQSAVRRLTPRECERLQGFPDDHTRIPWRKKPAEEFPDGPRYKACGNSMAVPVIRWIGARIQSSREET